MGIGQTVMRTVKERLGKLTDEAQANRLVARREAAPRVAIADDTLSLRSSPVARAAAAVDERARLLGQFPTLDIVLRDQDAFLKDITGRFAAQRRVTPLHPYRFDFSDYGIPVLKEWRTLLDGEVAKVEAHRESFRGRYPMGDPAEHDQVLQHIRALKKEIDGHIARGRINYERLQALTDYVSRAMGRFDREQLTPIQHLMLPADEAFQGYRRTSLAADLERYRKNRSTLFDHRTVLSDVNRESERFVADAQDPNQMKLVMLPNSEELNDEVFDSLIERGLFPIGVNRDLLLADGFNRPSAHFRTHDLRHSATIHDGWMRYRESRQATEPQMSELLSQTPLWRQELRAAKQSITDPEFRAAVDLVDFYYHHDRGFPQVPSSYDAKTMPILTRTLELYVTEKLGGQDTGFRQPVRKLNAAYAWLREFWQTRKPQEEALFNRP